MSPVNQTLEFQNQIIMGIPSFFSYVIRNHMRGVLLHPREWQARKINGLYMDCNSLIYESIQGVQQQQQQQHATTTATTTTTTASTLALYKEIGILVCQRIEELVQRIAPQNFVYISFDGVAPYAKMQHQRTRRYRGDFLDRMASASASAASSSSSSSSAVNVRAIIGTPTPGTPFMMWFSTHLNTHFREYRQRHPHLQVILSTSEEVGEGEQKLFEHARQMNAPTMEYAVYGLDADLFMLCLVHSQFYGRFHVVREAPEFIKSLKCELEPNQLYMLDIQQFAHSILQEMRLPPRNGHLDKLPLRRKIMDYVFLCFLLGNDFLPKFPAINIRSHGIEILLDVYRDYWRTRSDCNVYGFLTYWHNESGTWRIHWGNLAVFVARLAAEEPVAFAREHRRLMDQLVRRQKANPLGEFSWTGSSSPASSSKNEDPHDFNLIPQSYRQKEIYINPDVAGWQSRYYEALFTHQHAASPPRSMEEEVIIPYLQTLAWTLQYYTGSCRNWRWGYAPYHYAPLLQDVSAFLQQDSWKQKTPKQRDTLLTETAALQRQPPFCVADQLAYVIPPTGADGDVPKIQLRDFDWSYCQYFWEAHIHF